MKLPLPIEGKFGGPAKLGEMSAAVGLALSTCLSRRKVDNTRLCYVSTGGQLTSESPVEGQDSGPVPIIFKLKIRT
ncbi:hypothetical protein OUZ56_022695 [Daphnia magna]|uniref:Uncharacterized protein n=1 Tax=Daphnia magna TaxID=35525 RepID=A0ABR0AXF9_9CRUS|nr:hypothetical protein OUZ56_022695 [Daphnia magna]